MMIHKSLNSLVPRLGLAVLLVGYALTGSGPAAARDVHPDEPQFQPVILIQLAVSDLERSLAFYTETLGMELESKIDAIRWAKIKTAVPGLSLGLGEAANVMGSGTMSVNLAVADADLTRSLLESRGVEFLGETEEIPGVVRLADFQDPDGNRFRLAGPARKR